ncbi:MAG: acetolactate decarboxylase [Deltaproteobacteria bacterium]|nr:acetolactate decarboxylase [Deltaproteobacteria bacterium]
MRKCVLYTFFAFLFLFTGCVTAQKNVVTQTSTINALLSGLYDGTMTLEDLLKQGDFGIGTFDRLDGEMVVLDGRVYQIRADGRVYIPPLVLTTPFASVCRFDPDRELAIHESCSHPVVQDRVNELAPNGNMFCAVRITGLFSRMKTRSVPAQTRPYPALVEVTKHQAVFEMEQVSGTIVGFRSPPFVKGLNVPGFHLHFVSDDRRTGGHVLDFVLERGLVEVDVLNRFTLILPESAKDFQQLDLTGDRSGELNAVEK